MKDYKFSEIIKICRDGCCIDCPFDKYCDDMFNIPPLHWPNLGIKTGEEEQDDDGE